MSWKEDHVVNHSGSHDVAIVFISLFHEDSSSSKEWYPPCRLFFFNAAGWLDGSMIGLLCAFRFHEEQPAETSLTLVTNLSEAMQCREPPDRRFSDHKCGVSNTCTAEVCCAFRFHEE